MLDASDAKLVLALGRDSGGSIKPVGAGVLELLAAVGAWDVLKMVPGWASGSGFRGFLKVTGIFEKGSSSRGRLGSLSGFFGPSENGAGLSSSFWMPGGALAEDGECEDGECVDIYLF